MVGDSKFYNMAYIARSPTMKAVAIIDIPDFYLTDDVKADVIVYPMGYPNETIRQRVDLRPIPEKRILPEYQT